ncbi:hypothetical protein WAI453_008509 [Rhynchosporium graminicola]
MFAKYFFAKMKFTSVVTSAPIYNTISINEVATVRKAFFDAKYPQTGSILSTWIETVSLISHGVCKLRQPHQYLVKHKPFPSLSSLPVLKLAITRSQLK